MSNSKIRTGVLTVEVVQRAAAGEFVDWKSYERIETDGARLLAQGTGYSLSGLAEISTDVAGDYAGRPGALHLEGVKDLTPSAAEALAKHKGDLFLDGLTSVSLPVAKALACHEQALYLSGVTEI